MGAACVDGAAEENGVTETEIMRDIQLRASELGHRLWRNNVAQAWVGRLVKRYDDGSILLASPRPLHAGLAVGSSDLIGITSSGRFLSPEVKSSTGRMSTGQQAWIDRIRVQGGIAGVCRSVEQFEALVADA